MKGAGWEWTWVVDEKTKASVFTEEELEAWLAPSKDMAAIDQDINVALAEIKGFCSRLPFGDVFFGEKRHAFSEWFAEKLCRRGRSSTDAGEYLILRNQILAHLAENEGGRGPIAGQQDGDGSGRQPTVLEKNWPLLAIEPRTPAARRARDLILRAFPKDGPPPWMSKKRITDKANEARDPEDKRRFPEGAVSEPTVRRLLAGK
jgi:hypothetical protein